MGKSWENDGEIFMEDFDDDGMSQAFCFWGKTVVFRNRG